MGRPTRPRGCFGGRGGLGPRASGRWQPATTNSFGKSQARFSHRSSCPQLIGRGESKRRRVPVRFRCKPTARMPCLSVPSFNRGPIECRARVYREEDVASLVFCNPGMILCARSLDVSWELGVSCPVSCHPWPGHRRRASKGRMGTANERVPLFPTSERETPNVRDQNIAMPITGLSPAFPPRPPDMQCCLGGNGAAPT